MNINMQNIPENATGVLVVVSTSHMDWHWLVTFDQYYSTGTALSSPPHPPVRYILDTMIQQIQDGAYNTGAPAYGYNLVEISWLQRYLEDNPSAISTLAGFTDTLSFIGGGMTSPDNLVCNGEVFIRNYLVGRDVLNRVGLGNMIEDVCWIPDDFGSDPQLPVVIKAMGMSGVSFARVPGYQQGAGGPYTPAKGNPLSWELANNGVTFNWAAADGSTVVAQYMLCGFQNPGYGVIWGQNDQGAQADADKLNQFVTQNCVDINSSTKCSEASGGQQVMVNQPGTVMMAPCGGDFSVPDNELAQGVQIFNEQYFNPPSQGVYAVMGTFTDFMNYLSERKVSLQTLQGWDAMNKGFDPSNYWTGHFANYVELKLLQQKASIRLQAAETLSTLLRSQSDISSATLDGLNREIRAAWESLVPSSHHDYVNGTSPTSIYYSEQLPLLNLAADQARNTLDNSMRMLAASVHANPANTGDVPYVIFNPGGFDRNTGMVVEVPITSAIQGMTCYYLEGDSDVLCPIQVSYEKDMFLIWLDQIDCTGYTTVYFSTLSPNKAGIPPSIPQPEPTADSFYMNCGQVQIGISRAQGDGWALNDIWDNISGQTVSNGLCNQVQVYTEGSWGNPYQMGNEFDSQGFVPDADPSFNTVNGGILETGPYRWRFSGEARNGSGANITPLSIEYRLHYGSPIVEIITSGQARASSANSVVSNWSIAGAPQSIPAMNYGTGNHWNGPNFTPYWDGPTMRSTHDFLTLVNPANTDPNAPLCAIYHEGMRAWGYDSSLLTGILFRNTNDNTGRGALNSDVDTHTHRYAFRIPGGLSDPTSCQPQQESLGFQHGLLCAPLKSPVGGQGSLASMPPSGQLLSISGKALVRLARTQPGSGESQQIDYPISSPVPFSFVVRIYQPTNSQGDPNQTNWTLSIPFLGQISETSSFSNSASLVTALEDFIGNLSFSDSAPTQIDFSQMDTLTTVRIQTSRVNTGD